MKAIITQQSSQPALIAHVARIADAHAAASVLADYRSRKAANTLKRQDDDLNAFSDYLHRVKIKTTAEQLATQPAAWAGVTWGIVKGFVGYLLTLGYAIANINVKLSTIKTYCKLANQAGGISADELAKIVNVKGYSRAEAGRLDQQRERTRVSAEKAGANILTAAQIEQLRSQPDTPHGLRDRVIVALMLDLGLRVGEVIALNIEHIDLDAGRVVFYREKVSKTQTHQLPPALVADLREYLAVLPKRGPLVRGLLRGGGLNAQRATRFSVFQRLRELGASIDCPTLSPHDLRHTWATDKARRGVPIDRLTDAGGWNSPNVPLTRYIEPARIANQGVLGV